MFQIVEEAKKMRKMKKKTGGVLNYFKSLRNLIDIFSITTLFVTVTVWLFFMFAKIRPFTLAPVYKIYDERAFAEHGQFFDVVPTDYAACLRAFAQLESIISYKTIYVALQGLK